jgi:hypothetical protein
VKRRAVERAAVHAGREAGIALIMVIVVLVALAVIATPFALSMRSMESAALLGFEHEVARADAEVALAAARRHLVLTHPFLDATPYADDRAELSPPDLDRRHPTLLPRDPRGTIASVSIADESGKVHLGTASPYLLGNLLGGRTTLAQAVDERAETLPLTDASGFRGAGIAWAGLELVEYSAVGPDGLGECRRGLASANLARSAARPHAAGADVLDARLMLLAQHGWRIRPGVFDVFRRVDGLKDIGLYGELTYTADEVDRARPWLTVHGGAPRWRDPQRVRAVSTARGGGLELVVDDGRFYGAGTIVELRTASGEAEWNLSLGATDWGDGWRVLLLEPPALRHDDGGSVLRSLLRTPVNVNTCVPPVLEALLAGLGGSPVADVVNAREATLLADNLIAAELDTDPTLLRGLFEEQLEARELSRADLEAVIALVEGERLRAGQLTRDELQARFTGLVSGRGSHRIGRPAARALAGRIAAAAPASHEQLREVLDAALADGVLRPEQRETVLRNAVDSNDARLVGGTAPFAYDSRGVFALDAAASRNFPNGREQARVRMREVVSVGPEGESATRFATQRDFAAGLGRGWTTHPHQLESGAGTGRPPVVAETASGLLAGLIGGEPEAPGPGVQGEALVLGERLPGRAETLVGGRAGASELPLGSFTSPATVRSALPGTLHADEGAAGLTGSGPKGLSFADGVVLLPLDGMQPALVTAEDLPDAFAVEFWFEVEDPEAETILLDAGLDELEDRILIMLAGRELVLRVSDTSIPDFEAQMPAGHAPPAGEIRYAFDDGLALLPGVPYHLLAVVGGARDTQLALFVDGVPRGRRSFTTALVEDLPASDGSIQGVSGYGGELRLRVESTAGFPERGALRCGTEVVEYVQKTEDAFLVRAAGPQDPFGGRGRRDTFPSDHPASELVELVGWTRPMASERAAQGSLTLGSPLGEFALAELDPTQLSDQISFQVNVAGGPPFEQPLGTGLVAGNTTLPLRASGGVPLLPDSFQSSGGHAILFCDYGGNALVGQSIGLSLPGGTGSVQVTVPAQTAGGWLGGGEVIRYQGFDGQRLTGVQRNQQGIPVSAGGEPSDLLTASQSNGIPGGSNAWDVPREFLTTIDDTILGVLPGLPPNPRVLVFPISVAVAGGNLFDDFHPAPDGSLAQDSALIQIGVDFEEGSDATEWVRWDTTTAGEFVRDDADAIDDALDVMRTESLWHPNNPVGEDTVDTLNDRLDFRGQDGTPDGQHAVSGTAGRVLPVHVLGHPALVPEFEVQGGRPGRHDSVTLVDPDAQRKEWHRVNHATTTDQDYGGYCLVGLRDPVSDEFLRTDQYRDGEYRLLISEQVLDRYFEDDSSARRIVEGFNVDSRLVTRMLCAPSGELPTGPIEAFRLGGDHAGRRSTGQAIVDELRFFRPAAPGALLPNTARFVLAEEFELDDERELTLRVDELQFSLARQRNPVLGADALEILGTLPQAGGLLLVGEEIVGYAGLDPVDSGKVFLTGRGLYGTARAYHRQGETVLPLLAWPVSPLAASIDEQDATLALADASGFPLAGGLVWVGEELLEYTARDADGLHMPTRAGGNRFDPQGLLRGRFGTAPAAHQTGAMVRWMPARHRDRSLLGHDVPESESLALPVRAPGAFFTDLIVEAFLPLPGVALDVRVVLDGLASPHADPAGSAHLVGGRAVTGGAEPTTRLALPVLRQGEGLEVWLYAAWEPGAFDALDHASNAWKLVPEVDVVVVGALQPARVLEHEEWR